MGQEVSSLPNRPHNFPIFSITFSSDTIKVIEASSEVVKIIRTVIVQHYTKKIQSEVKSKGGNVVYLKLQGSPFEKEGKKEDGVMVKAMVCALLERLRSAGWELALSSNLSRRQDSSTLFFRQVPVTSYAGCKMMCLCLSGDDKLQLINGPAEARSVLAECSKELLQKQSCGNNYFEVQLRGNVWRVSLKKDWFLSRKILLDCFTQFLRLRYFFYGTANLLGSADCIFFISDGGDMGLQEFCLLSLNNDNHIRLINAPDEVIQAARNCLKERWTRGIQKAGTKTGGNFYEFKITGSPWSSCGVEAIESRLLMTVLLQQLVQVGWAVVTAFDISRTAANKAVFLLHRCVAANIPHFAICPAHVNFIRIINANEDMVQLVKETVQETWTVGIESEIVYGNSYEMTLAGSPWESSGEVFELTRAMMARILYELGKRGWRPICSADVSSQYLNDGKKAHCHPLDVHSWFIAYTGCNQASAPAQETEPQEPVPLALPVPNEIVPSGSLYPSLQNEPPPSYEDAVSDTPEKGR